MMGRGSKSKPSFSLALAVAWLGVGCTGATTPPPPPEPEPAAAAAEAEPPPPELTSLPPSRLIAPTASPYDEAAAYSERLGGRAIVIAIGAEIVYAAGQNGHAVDEPHPIHSASESFWGPVAVAAEADGLFDLDEPVSFSISEFANLPGKRDMRIRHLLQYTSGLEAGVWPLIREHPPNLYARALELDLVAPPGERFQFGPSHLGVLGEVLRRKLEAEGLDPLAYLQRRILDRIGLEIADWKRDTVGNPDLANGASLTAAQWVKFGIWLRDRGSWKGESIVPADDLAACFEGSDVQSRFGLTLWLNPEAGDSPEQAFFPDGPRDLVVAAGTGNQRLYVIPSLDLVAARLGEANRGWRDREFLTLIVDARRRPPGEASIEGE